MTCSTPARWSATGGSISPVEGAAVTWTAPATGSQVTVTANPNRGRPCSVVMTAISPSRRLLSNPIDRVYTAGLAGSGFVADVTIMPINVSFSRIQVREEEVNASATGYYDTVLGWDGIRHPAGVWLTPNIQNSGAVDTVGTNPPGTGGPFSRGEFTWAIPQHYRIMGDGGNGMSYSTGVHAQVMIGNDGSEGTAKEGAARGRTP
ncbi:hypothetical protein [Sphaerothrix gracilis]|uniref:hypothetical protein n=1 Tax=Sphaerothrix gracilis TaxID=3151835 RepID=UPI0031FC5925